MHPAKLNPWVLNNSRQRENNGVIWLVISWNIYVSTRQLAAGCCLTSSSDENSWGRGSTFLMEQSCNRTHRFRLWSLLHILLEQPPTGSWFWRTRPQHSNKMKLIHEAAGTLSLTFRQQQESERGDQQLVTRNHGSACTGLGKDDMAYKYNVT